MTNFSEKLKDFLYNSIDYLIMLLIIVSVVGIIGWRLDILLGDKPSIASSGDVEVIIEREAKDGKEEASDDEATKDPDQKKDLEKESPDKTHTEELPPVTPEPSSSESIKVFIPAGSLPGKIASILYENGVIESSRDFINKAVELKADTKLKSGTFHILKDSSYEEVINIITK